MAKAFRVNGTRVDQRPVIAGITFPYLARFDQSAALTARPTQASKAPDLLACVDLAPGRPYNAANSEQRSNYDGSGNGLAV